MRNFWTFLLKDPLRKIIALVLTIILYAVLNEGKQREVTVDVPLKVVCGDDVFLPGHNRNYMARVTLRGTESQIKQLKEKEDVTGALTITQNTPGFDSGKITMTLSPSDFSAPRGVEVIRVEQPQELDFQVQRRVNNRRIAVRPDFTGSVPPGLTVDKITSSPGYITVSGAESAVNNLREVVTVPLNVDGETVSFSKPSVALKNPEPDKLTFSRNDVEVFVSIVQMPDVERKLSNIPVRFVIPQQRGESVFPDRDTVTVIVSGQQSVINRITEKDVLVLADLSDPAYEVAGEHTVMLRAVLNSASGNLRISSIEPEKIQIKCVVHKENK